MRWALLLVVCGGCLGFTGARDDQPTADLLACQVDDDCSAGCEQIAADLRVPGAPPAAVTSSRCEAVGMGGTDSQAAMSGVGCICDLPGGGAWIVATSSSGCALSGRTNDCLYDASEFPGCTPGDNSCAAVCDTLRSRVAADAARTHDASVHGAVCDGGAACLCVIALDGIRRAWNPAGPPYDADCGRSARDILSDAGLLSHP